MEPGYRQSGEERAEVDLVAEDVCVADNDGDHEVQGRQAVSHKARASALAPAMTTPSTAAATGSAVGFAARSATVAPSSSASVSQHRQPHPPTSGYGSGKRQSIVGLTYAVVDGTSPGVAVPPVPSRSNGGSLSLGDVPYVQQHVLTPWSFVAPSPLPATANDGDGINSLSDVGVEYEVSTFMQMGNLHIQSSNPNMSCAHPFQHIEVWVWGCLANRKLLMSIFTIMPYRCLTL